MDAVFTVLVLQGLLCHLANSQVVLSGDPGEIPPNPHKGKDAGMSGTIKMGTPDLSDEDSMAIHMPSYLKCDACRLIAIKISDTFQKEIDKFASVKRGDKELSEDRVVEILEDVCDDPWEQHGIKEIDGVNRLAGPGFETADIPGVMQGGGKWPFRFKQMCEIMVGDIGEDVIYETLRKSKAKGLEKRLCYKPVESKTAFCAEKKGKPSKKGSKSEKAKKKEPSKKHNEL